jgi:hypothetical protein
MVKPWPEDKDWAEAGEGRINTPIKKIKRAAVGTNFLKKLKNILIIF